jgi:hypothetical protein
MSQSQVTTQQKQLQSMLLIVLLALLALLVQQANKELPELKAQLDQQVQLEVLEALVQQAHKVQWDQQAIKA